MPEKSDSRNGSLDHDHSKCSQQGHAVSSSWAPAVPWVLFPKPRRVQKSRTPTTATTAQGTESRLAVCEMGSSSLRLYSQGLLLKPSILSSRLDFGLIVNYSSAFSSPHWVQCVPFSEAPDILLCSPSMDNFLLRLIIIITSLDYLSTLLTGLLHMVSSLIHSSRHSGAHFPKALLLWFGIIEPLLDAMYCVGRWWCEGK